MSARARSSEGSGGSQQRCCPRPARPHGGESIPQSVLPLPRRWALCRSATGAHRAGAPAEAAVPPLCNQSSSRLLWMEINAVPKPPVSWAAVPPLPYTLSPSCNPRGTETRSTAGGAAGSPPRAWPSPASGAVPWSLGGPRPLPPASPPPGQGHSRTQRVLSHLPEPGPPLLCLEVLPPLGVGRRGPRLQPLSILVPCPPTPPHPRGFHARQRPWSPEGRGWAA